MKEYSSFEEIDRDLKILQLQKQIDQEEVKLASSRTKEALKPMNLLDSAACAVKKKVKELTAVAKGVGTGLLQR